MQNVVSRIPDAKVWRVQQCRAKEDVHSRIRRSGRRFNDTDAKFASPPGSGGLGW